MKSAVTSVPAKTRSDSAVVHALNLVLADSYALMANTHYAHWNVEGPGFFALHKAFEEQYEHLFRAVDDIAERIRGLDAYAIGGLRNFAAEANIEEFKNPVAAKDYVTSLIVAHENYALCAKYGGDRRSSVRARSLRQSLS